MKGYSSRRRCLRILAAAGGLGLSRTTFAGAVGRPARTLYSWQGIALGADAEIRLAHEDRQAAEAVFARCAAEIERIEAMFSLYRPDSAIARLNQSGRLDTAPDTFLHLLDTALDFARVSEGSFDPTVQPLWDLYARYFAGHRSEAEGPSDAVIDAAAARVGHAAVIRHARDVRFAQAGMGITLNGVAQGYLTDRIVAALRDCGLSSALVETGETYAVGRHPSGRPWRIGLRDSAAPARLVRSITLADRAVATSAGYGTPFDRTGRFHHIFDPRTGHSASRYASVTVLAPSATLADGLSTALYVMPSVRAFELVDAMPGVAAWFTLADGSVRQRGKP